MLLFIDCCRPTTTTAKSTTTTTTTKTTTATTITTTTTAKTTTTTTTTTKITTTAKTTITTTKTAKTMTTTPTTVTTTTMMTTTHYSLPLKSPTSREITFYWRYVQIINLITNISRVKSKKKDNTMSVFSGSRIARSLVFGQLIVYHCLSFCFDHCIVCASIYDFWLPPLVSSNFSIAAKY